jgi:hypothetical protein
VTVDQLMSKLNWERSRRETQIARHRDDPREFEDAYLGIGRQVVTPRDLERQAARIQPTHSELAARNHVPMPSRTRLPGAALVALLGGFDDDLLESLQRQTGHRPALGLLIERMVHERRAGRTFEAFLGTGYTDVDLARGFLGLSTDDLPEVFEALARHSELSSVATMMGQLSGNHPRRS